MLSDVNDANLDATPRRACHRRSLFEHWNVSKANALCFSRGGTRGKREHSERCVNLRETREGCASTVT